MNTTRPSASSLSARGLPKESSDPGLRLHLRCGPQSGIVLRRSNRAAHQQEVSTIVGPRDRAIIAVMTYTFARAGGDTAHGCLVGGEIERTGIQVKPDEVAQ
jgi:hypothetical protein